MALRRHGSAFAGLLALPILALPLAGCGGTPTLDYHATLRPVNGSNVSGTVHVTYAAPHLVVRIDARNLAGDRVHGQLIRAGAGSAGGAQGCPSGAGRLAPGRAKGLYGPVVLRLVPFPTVGQGGRLHFADVYVVGNAKRLEPIPGRLVVLEGLRSADAGGGSAATYRPSWPVACGRLSPAPGS